MTIDNFQLQIAEKFPPFQLAIVNCQLSFVNISAVSTHSGRDGRMAQKQTRSGVGSGLLEPRGPARYCAFFNAVATSPTCTLLSMTRPLAPTTKMVGSMWMPYCVAGRLLRP